MPYHCHCLKQVLTAIWDEEIVLYHPLSGDTYCFGNAAKDIVQLCLSLERFSKEHLTQLLSYYLDNELFTTEYLDLVVNELFEKNLIVLEAE